MSHLTVGLNAVFAAAFFGATETKHTKVATLRIANEETNLSVARLCAPLEVGDARLEPLGEVTPEHEIADSGLGQDAKNSNLTRQKLIKGVRYL